MCLQTLRGELEAMKMKDLEDISSDITHSQAVVNQLKHNGETLTYTMVVEKILRSLMDDFENVVSTIEESRNLEEMIIDDLEDSFEANNRRRRKIISDGGSLTKKYDHQGRQGDVCATQLRTRTQRLRLR